MDKKIIVVWIESEGRYEDQRHYLAREVYDRSCKVGAEAFVDKHPDAWVIYGEFCKVTPKHTEIVLPELE